MGKQTFTVGEEKAQKPIVEVTIDGQKISAPEGTSIYDLVIQMGKTLPSMCYHYTFSPFGSCGICLVEVEGKKAPVRSCTAPITAGMVVRTQDEAPQLRDAQKKAIEKHLTTHPLDCPVCDADGRCELQDMSYNFKISEIGTVKQKGIPEDTRSIVLDFNMNRCILCGQCINICKEVQMVDALQFLKKDGHTHVVAKGDTGLYCEFCGDCLEVCPVGAITNKFSKYVYKPWQLRTTQTSCPYCGDGCALVMDTKEDQVVRVRSNLTWKSWRILLPHDRPVKRYGKAKLAKHEQTVNGHGGICGRSRFGFQFVNSPERLRQPLARRNGDLVPTPWFVMMNEVAQRLREIKARHGGQAIAGLMTGRCTNEEIYLFQKFMRLVLGTNHIDSSARYGLINFALAMKRSVGKGRGMATFADLTLAKVSLVIGSDITETNPVAALRLKEAMRNYKSTVIVADAAKTNMAKLATHHLQHRPGSERALIQGLIKAVIEQGWVDQEFAQRHPDLLSKIREAVSPITLDWVQGETGIEPAKIQEMAERFAKAETAVLVCGEGILRRAGGYENTRLLIDLAAITGKLDQPGSGVTAMCRENNEQGTLDWGGVPEFLPGQGAATDAAERQKLEAAWGDRIPSDSGEGLMGILDRARSGEIKALYLVGENPVGTLPASLKVREALQAVSSNGGFVICQDLFLTETGKLADVVLPACSFAEKEGTFTNFEGRHLPVREALEPMEECKPDWEIFTELAGEMGYPLSYGSAEEIRKEMTDLMPDMMKDRSGKPEERGVSLSPEALASGLERRYARVPAGSGDVTPEYPLRLVMGPILYHSGKLTTRAEGLIKIFDKRSLHVNPADAQRLGIGEGDRVKLRSPLGAAEAAVELKEMLPEGLCFFPEHFTDPAVKDLLPCELDPETSVPYFKSGAVKLEKIG